MMATKHELREQALTNLSMVQESLEEYRGNGQAIKPMSANILIMLLRMTRIIVLELGEEAHVA